VPAVRTQGDSGPIGPVLCRILQMNFAERSFYEFR
jgi:hypothetical protein